MFWIRYYLDKVLALCKERVRICRESGNIDGLQRTPGNQTLILQDHRNLDGARALMQKQERICKGLGNVSSPQRFWDQILILEKKKDMDGTLALLNEAEEILEKQGYQEDLKDLRN